MDSASNDALESFIRSERLPPQFLDLVGQFHQALANAIVRRQTELQHPILVGLCGPQGSGKSTNAAVLQILLESRGLRVATLSIDDVYMTRVARLAMARRIHPLLATRGPPGTHEVERLEAVIGELLDGASLALPSFDKATDNPRPKKDWRWFDGPADVVVLEGWCVGAAPQPLALLSEAINELERDEDPDGVWRSFTNKALQTYQPLFDQLELLIQLRPPGFETVMSWRREQEAKLRGQTAGRRDLRVMSDGDIARFVQHYERLTRHILSEMPKRADIVVDLGAERDVKQLHFRRD